MTTPQKEPSRILTTGYRLAGSTLNATRSFAKSVGSNLSGALAEAIEKDREKFGQQPPRRPVPVNNIAPEQPEKAQQAAPTPPPQKENAANPAAATQRSIDENMMALAFLAHTYKIDATDAALLEAMKGVTCTGLPTAEKRILHVSAAGLAVTLSATEVSTKKSDLTESEARALASFAAANPGMRAKGVMIEDCSEKDRLLLTRIAAEYGLKVLNPAPAPEVASEAKTETPATVQPETVAPAAMPQPDTEVPPGVVPDAPTPGVVRAPLAANIADLLEKFEIDPETYHRARDLVIAKNKANPNMLQVELDITRSKAKTLLNIMNIEGVLKRHDNEISKTAIKTSFTVAATAAETVAAPPVPETPAPQKGPAAPGPT